MTKPNRFILDRRAARYLVDVALSGSSKDDLTPVICGALVQVTSGEIRVTCTDRFRAHTALLPSTGDGKKWPDFEFIMPRAALLWLSKNLSYFGSYLADLHRVLIEVSDHTETLGGALAAGRLTVTVMESDSADAPTVVWSGTHTRGNFPPLFERLVLPAREAEASSTPVSGNLALVSGARVLGLGGSEDAPIIKLTVNKTDSGKSGPVYMAWTHRDETAPYAEAIVQPRLIVR